MKFAKMKFILPAILAVVLLIGVTAYAASNYGTSGDPLITLSYLKDTLTPSIMDKLQIEIDSAVHDLENAIGSGPDAADSYKVVTLSKGQKIVGSVGCEILLRVGTAAVSAADNPGLIDISSAGTLNNGSALTANHLYMVSIAGNGIQATATTVKILIRGAYTVS